MTPLEGTHILRSKLLGGAAVAAVILTGTVTQPAVADEEISSPLAAIQAVAPEILAGEPVDPPPVGEDPISEDLVLNVRIDIPVDPAEGITLFDPDGTIIGIGLPNAENASDATPEGNGVVSYDNGDGSSTVPVPKDDGSVQITTVIDTPDAPTRYEYPLDLPEGATATLDAETGYVSLLDADGVWIGGVAPAWAKDANGVDVATHYELTGTTLTQVIDHATGMAYPIVADPWLGVALIKSAVWARYLWQYSPTLKVYPTVWGRTAPLGARWAAWAETLSKTPRTGWPYPDTGSMSNQFYCHYDIVRLRAPNKEYWGLDSKLPNRGYAGFVANECN